MSDILVWVVIGIVALAVIALLVWFCIKFFKMKPEERTELIIQFLIGLVTLAEDTFVGSEKGAEKIAWVEKQFNSTAPWFLKIVLAFTKSENLKSLIEKALAKAKDIKWDKFKNAQ